MRTGFRWAADSLILCGCVVLLHSQIAPFGLVFEAVVSLVPWLSGVVLGLALAALEPTRPGKWRRATATLGLAGASVFVVWFVDVTGIASQFGFMLMRRSLEECRLAEAFPSSIVGHRVDAVTRESRGVAITFTSAGFPDLAGFAWCADGVATVENQIAMPLGEGWYRVRRPRSHRSGWCR
jgi:hypothetical protein